VLSSFLATAGEGDRLAFEPYHLAAEIVRAAPGGVPAEAAAAVAEGRRRQGQLAAQALRAIVRDLCAAGHDRVAAALLVNRAGWITDLLAHSLSAPEHPPVAEGLAIRDALRFAAGQAGVQLTEIDEKPLPETAPATLQRPWPDIASRLAALGATVGKPWRKAQKLACLSAWLAVAAL
jgi:hypothetical protein